MQKIVVLSGAGVSAESGLSTFRDSDGLWEKFDINVVASIDGWRKNPALVLEFYNARRKQLKTVAPNPAHYALADLQKDFHVSIVTQNVDDLHERAGSEHVMHLHGELRKVRSTRFEELIYPWEEELNLGDLCEKGHQLRPHIVWFGEMVPLIGAATLEVASADILMVIGTSMQVYPAAGLVHHAATGTPIYYIDPRPALESGDLPGLEVIAQPASTGVLELAKRLRN
jgi:NAD-dependent deacetylase